MYGASSPRSSPERLPKKFTEPLLPNDGPSSKKQIMFEDDNAPAAGISVAEAVYNVLNVYVGLGLLSKPYAIAEGGWLAVPTLALLCFVANITGKLIVSGFAKLPPEARSYAGLGDKAFGAPGRAFVSGVITLEFFGALMVVLIFVWKNALLLAPWYLPDAIISVETVALVLTQDSNSACTRHRCICALFSLWRVHCVWYRS